jgi:cobaltochelatase CobS
MPPQPRIPARFLTREELEAQLGPPGDYITAPGDKELLIEWALTAGHPDSVRALSTVALANLYVASAPPQPTELQQIATEIFHRVASHFTGGPFDHETTRTIVREELERLAPRRLEVSGPRGVVSLGSTVHYRTPAVLRAVGRGHHVMMVGPAGCGKTTIGEHVATALQLPFYITSTINDTHELTGFIDGRGTYHATPFRYAFEHGGVWVADEIDAWDASALLAANSALANGFAVFPDVQIPIKRHADFRMVATANTFGTGADRVYIGRNELDAASLDRFALITVDYDLTLERWFSGGNDKWLDYVWRIRKAVNEKKIRHVVSSRAIAMGAAALADGETWDDTIALYLRKGMNDNDWSKVDD